MNTCGTCKFKGAEAWRTLDPGEGADERSGYFECHRVKHDDDYDLVPGQGALTQDGDGYKAILFVEDSFGCSLWEPK